MIALDLHAPQIQGFFDIPIDHLMGVPILGEYFEGKNLEDIVIVSPDHGGVTRARKLADRLKAPIAIIDKRRPRPNVAEVMNIVGNIEGRLLSSSMTLLILQVRLHLLLMRSLKTERKKYMHAVHTLYYQALR